MGIFGEWANEIRIWKIIPQHVCKIILSAFHQYFQGC